MGKFIGSIIVKPLDSLRWELQEEITYITDNKEYINIPTGFITDFASVPRLFWNIIPPWGKYGKAAIVHDYIYKKLLFTRAYCDKLFLLIMKELKVPLWKRLTMYRAVRLGGWIPYNRYKKKEQIK
ncbi:MAG: DUF1353 domain-containing protein [Candidatus Thorarchaeota archaeon]